MGKRITTKEKVKSKAIKPIIVKDKEAGMTFFCEDIETAKKIQDYIHDYYSRENYE